MDVKLTLPAYVSTGDRDRRIVASSSSLISLVSLRLLDQSHFKQREYRKGVHVLLER